MAEKSNGLAVKGRTLCIYLPASLMKGLLDLVPKFDARCVGPSRIVQHAVHALMVKHGLATGDYLPRTRRLPSGGDPRKTTVAGQPMAVREPTRVSPGDRPMKLDDAIVRRPRT